MHKTTTHIIAIRHGETDWNLQARYQGQIDIGLNRIGRQQAAATALALADLPLQAIYSSDLARAWQTAEELAGGRELAPVPITGLREQHFGDFQGWTTEEIRARWPQDLERWLRRDPDFGPSGGESRHSFSQRCVGTITELALRHRGACIAVVTHGGVLDCLYRAAQGIALDAERRWSLENAAVSRLQHGLDGFSLQSWGDVSHLDASPRDEPVQTFPAP